MNKSCQTYEWVMSDIWMSRVSNKTQRDLRAQQDTNNASNLCPLCVVCWYVGEAIGFNVCWYVGEDIGFLRCVCLVACVGLVATRHTQHKKPMSPPTYQHTLWRIVREHERNRYVHLFKQALNHEKRPTHTHTEPWKYTGLSLCVFRVFPLNHRALHHGNTHRERLE